MRRSVYGFCLGGCIEVRIEVRLAFGNEDAAGYTHADAGYNADYTHADAGYNADYTHADAGYNDGDGDAEEESHPSQTLAYP